MRDHIIYPGEQKTVSYWTRKWGISPSELNEAILETGSLHVKEIRQYLKSKKREISLHGLSQFIRLRLSL
ncbi:MAG TPA: DUF3606 domain-containing protein [Bacteroidia bacterium]|jgi:hypothetical protein